MKKLLDPTTIHPELLMNYRASAATMKSVADAFFAANDAYYAICATVNKIPSVAGFDRTEAARVYAENEAKRAAIIEQCATAKATAERRYLDWQEARRMFFALCDQIQAEAAC